MRNWKKILMVAAVTLTTGLALADSYECENRGRKRYCIVKNDEGKKIGIIVFNLPNV